MITFTHAYKAYASGTVALRDVSLQIDRGEFVFLTGPSGAGKTTLFRLLSAFDRSTSGGVEVAGYSLNALTNKQIPQFRRRIGVIYQDFRLLQRRTVFENVALPLEIRGDGQSQIDRRVRDMLDHVGLNSKTRDYPEQLSGGEQQRVAIARALVHQPAVLIADEPTGNLDPELSWDIMKLLEKANAQGTTVFVATHDHELVRRCPHRLIKLEAGAVVGS
ncbi:MAG: cell division ATP-binding protein FtsE [Bdellovibrionales bacterium]